LEKNAIREATRLLPFRGASGPDGARADGSVDANMNTTLGKTDTKPNSGSFKQIDNKASGFIPNFSSEELGEETERFSALAHGYNPGRVFSRTIHDGNGNSFSSFVNSAENITDFINSEGRMATLVTPPNGFGPNTTVASAAGFVPNFQQLEGSLTSGGTVLNDSINSLITTIDALKAAINDLKLSQSNTQTAPTSTPNMPEPTEVPPAPPESAGGVYTLNIQVNGQDAGAVEVGPNENIEQQLASLTALVHNLSLAQNGKQVPPPSIA